MKMRTVLCAMAVVSLGCGETPGKPNNGGSNNGGSNNGGSNNGGSNNGGSNNGGSNNGGSNNGGSNNGGCSIATPEFHRPEATDCDLPRAAGVTTDIGGDCASDADCVDGLNGRCLEQFRTNTTYCSYDACTTDSDCDSAACVCRGEGTNAPNVCLPGNCVTDADCGETGFCSPSQGSCGAYDGNIGYFCHTCKDECVTDADCGGTPSTTYCAYDQGAGYWKCSSDQCVG